MELSILVGVKNSMDSNQYYDILDDALKEPAAVHLGKNWVLMYDNASVHTSNVTKIYLGDNSIVILAWSVKCSDIKMAENAWRWLAREVYQVGKQHDYYELWAAAVVEC